jgi:hypothetical protein
MLMVPSSRNISVGIVIRLGDRDIFRFPPVVTDFVFLWRPLSLSLKGEEIKWPENEADYYPPFSAESASKWVELYLHSLICFYDVHIDLIFYNPLAYILRYLTYVHLFCAMGSVWSNSIRFVCKAEIISY